MHWLSQLFSFMCPSEWYGGLCLAADFNNPQPFGNRFSSLFFLKDVLILCGSDQSLKGHSAELQHAENVPPKMKTCEVERAGARVVSPLSFY